MCGQTVFFRPSPPSLEEAASIAAEGFVQPISKSLKDDVQNHLTECPTSFTILDIEGRAIGFVLFKKFSEILYISGIILRQNYQGRGLGREAVRSAKLMARAEWFALRTQSPRMWRVGEQLAREWFPSPSIRHQPEIQRRAENLASVLGMTGVIAPGFYGAPLYGVKPTHPNIRIQNWWDSICSFERGDAVLCLGRF